MDLSLEVCAVYKGLDSWLYLAVFCKSVGSSDLLKSSFDFITRMRVALSLLLVFVAYAATAEKAAEDNYYPAYYGPNVVAPRFLITTTTTVTTVSTSVSVIACTSGQYGGLAMAAYNLLGPCPAGRRRRGILENIGDDNDEQFSIVPSAVQRYTIVLYFFFLKWGSRNVLITNLRYLFFSDAIELRLPKYQTEKPVLLIHNT